MEPFKLLINEDVVRAIGSCVARAWPEFRRAGASSGRRSAGWMRWS